MPGVSRRRFDVCRPRHSRAGGYFLLRQGLAECGCKVLYRYVAKALARRGSSPPVMRRRY